MPPEFSPGGSFHENGLRSLNAALWRIRSQYPARSFPRKAGIFAGAIRPSRFRGMMQWHAGDRPHATDTFSLAAQAGAGVTQGNISGSDCS